MAVVLNLYIHNIKGSHIKLVLATAATAQITNDHNYRRTQVEWHLHWKHTQPADSMAVAFVHHFYSSNAPLFFAWNL